MTELTELTELQGGNANTVIRIGDTVRRQPLGGEFVHQLLRHFEGREWPGAPRFRGIDKSGLEVLTYLPGRVVVQGPRKDPELWPDESLLRVGALVRAFHDLTAGTPLAGAAEVVCHNDLAPRNMVSLAGSDGTYRPFAFIDWDKAAPGPRLKDLGYLCWQFFLPGPAEPDPADVGRLIRLTCEGYQLSDRSHLIAAMLHRQAETVRGVEAAAAAGDAACRSLIEDGTVAADRADHLWTAANRDALESALR